MIQCSAVECMALCVGGWILYVFYCVVSAAPYTGLIHSYYLLISSNGVKADNLTHQGVPRERYEVTEGRGTIEYLDSTVLLKSYRKFSWNIFLSIGQLYKKYLHTNHRRIFFNLRGPPYLEKNLITSHQIGMN